MKRIIVIPALLMLIALPEIFGQPLAKDDLQASMSSFDIQKLEGKTVVKVVMDSSVKIFDEPTFAKLKNMEFKDGTIEVRVRSKFLPNAPNWARGFIGIAFRISNDNSKFESIYIRPDNGRVDDQVRRNHTVQYFAFPDYKFDRMRKDFPEKYESYADIGMNEWIKLKIVVKGSEARLYVNESKQPTLVVTDMKNGQDMTGAIGIWVGPGTEGYFSDLKVSK